MRTTECLLLIALTASSVKRNALVCRPSVRPSLFVPCFLQPKWGCGVFVLTLIRPAAHKQRDSSGGNMRRGQHTFQSEYYEDGHTCYLTDLRSFCVFVYLYYGYYGRLIRT